MTQHGIGKKEEKSADRDVQIRVVTQTHQGAETLLHQRLEQQLVVVADRTPRTKKAGFVCFGVAGLPTRMGQECVEGQIEQR